MRTVRKEVIAEAWRKLSKKQKRELLEEILYLLERNSTDAAPVFLQYDPVDDEMYVRSHFIGRGAVVRRFCPSFLEDWLPREWGKRARLQRLEELIEETLEELDGLEF
ncbi:hypothetical protein Hydth_0537 [Hydrogenobacter thermophilus TK-6]|uniref:Uncharacterized protein n=1 Tax=Hydrogenobacter thermophilus (strain DSM 6534 / IAM 12695 / TK-6) TaxID=608538 RepID=D3DGQ0_HYDTT|nr:hypothetical protein [Hydrogenobacter thermophilus]ADO44937.1 hypothetical protein Hydth_0537 [Hydrogenobacter thermophilus TK-6]BAI69002.1 hypothetical protein HTH_0539 [Hydrogenobacter thermophilus TK-6]